MLRVSIPVAGKTLNPAGSAPPRPQQIAKFEPKTAPIIDIDELCVKHAEFLRATQNAFNQRDTSQFHKAITAYTDWFKERDIKLVAQEG